MNIAPVATSTSPPDGLPLPACPPTSTRRSRRRRSRGYSLLEILVVLSIIALLSGVVAIVVVKHLEKARIETTRQSALALRNAVSIFRMNDGSAECPTVEKLFETEAIDRASKTTDAWDQRFVIECDDTSTAMVVSGGPDRQIGTADDIRVPEPPRVASQ